MKIGGKEYKFSWSNYLTQLLVYTVLYFGCLLLEFNQWMAIIIAIFVSAILCDTPWILNEKEKHE